MPIDDRHPVSRLLAASVLCGLMAAPSLAHSETSPKSSAHNPVESIQLSNGVLVDHFVKGAGKRPKAADKVTVHYVGRFPDGRVFDSSVARGAPATFYLNKVVRCWSLGLQQMQEGGRARIGCPPHTAYGTQGVPGAIPPNSTLFFDVELFKVN